MKKFEEEVRKNGGGCFEVFKNGKTIYEIQGLKSSPLIIFGDWISPEDHQAEIEKLKSQLEQQRPEIPEVAAEYLKRSKFRHKGVRFSLVGALKCTDFIDDKTRKWLEDWHNQEIFAQAWINGYTVKEKRFYLKHKSVLIVDPDSDDSDVEELYLGAGGNFVPYKHLAKIFTQSQIDSMETGSYEQIPVEENKC